MYRVCPKREWIFLFLFLFLSLLPPPLDSSLPLLPFSVARWLNCYLATRKEANERPLVGVKASRKSIRPICMPKMAHGSWAMGFWPTLRAVLDSTVESVQRQLRPVGTESTQCVWKATELELELWNEWRVTAELKVENSMKQWVWQARFVYFYLFAGNV